MAAEENSLDVSKDKKIPILVNGKKKKYQISSELKLDFLLEKMIDFEDILDDNELQKVECLSVQSNNLSKLPKNFTKNLTNLTKLDLSDNNIQELDSGFEALVNLREFLIDKNQLNHFPVYITELINLRLISARGNKLSNIPDNFVNLVNLRELDLSGNKIKSLEESLGMLNKLKSLMLSNNEFKAVPKCVTDGLEGLETLDLSHNSIYELTAPLSNNLKILYFNNNPRNDKFPGWLLTQRFSEMEEIVLDETVFSSFEVPDLSTPLHVKRFSMVQCGISDADFEQISRYMVDLEYLNIGNYLRNHENSYWVMPVRGFKHPEKLSEFSIQSASLPAIPKEVNLLRNLTSLNVSRNSISSLPDEICELDKLEIFNAAHNNLYALPQAIGNLKALRILFLETNGLSSLPDSVVNLEHLEYLDLYNNEFLEVPVQLGSIPNLKALDVEGNVFKTDNLQINNIEYLTARNALRSTSNILLLRSNVPKVFGDTDDESPCSPLSYETDCADEEQKSWMDLNLSDIGSVEDWDNEDSADEYDPTVQQRTYQPHTPFTVSSFFYYGNFCPADLHAARISDQLAAMQARRQAPGIIEEGQFDDA